MKNFSLQGDMPEGVNPIVRCGCGRTVNADMMRDVRPVKTTCSSRAANNGHRCVRALKESTHVCDACTEYLHRNGLLSREELMRAHGADAATIAKARKVDRESGGKLSIEPKKLGDLT